MTYEIAMFPLGTVLLPGTPLPLHIFEDRYRTMIHDAMHGDQCFGVTLITRGAEVGGGEERSSVGVLATIIEAKEFDDGRWAVGAMGGRRLRVVEWLPDDPYPLARIDFWPDEPTGTLSADQVERIVSLIDEVGSMATSLGYAPILLRHDLPADPVELSYVLSAASPLGPSDRHDLLCAEGPTTRLDLLETRLRDQRVLFGAEIAMTGQDPDTV